jgi:3-methyladenine DNA glycosylase AlkD
VTAEDVLAELEAAASPEEAAKSARYFKTGPGEYGEGDRFLGLHLTTVTTLAKRNLGMPVAELERLLESEFHEARTTALAIMHQEARKKTTTEARRAELYELYLRRHDRINNWDLVDVACRSVVGGYLMDKPRDILYRLARSPNLWERRTAMVSCWTFIRAGQTDDAIAIAELLLGDKEDLIHKAVGWMLRDVGTADPAPLAAFLDAHAATMPRTALRYAIEKFDPETRQHYLGLRAAR